jgi:hypothetical protein
MPSSTNQKTSQQKGKQGEFLVFGELIKRGADLYLPVIDIGIDAIVRQNDGSYLQVQVKSTEAKEQAGWFNVWDIDEYEGKGLYIVCVDMSVEPPDIWILPSEIFIRYATVSHSKEGRKYTLAVDVRDRSHGYQLRRDLLQEYYGAWKLLAK